VTLKHLASCILLVTSDFASHVLAAISRERPDAVLLCSESKTLEITCPQRVRMGRAEDGGWDVCVAGPYNIVKPCLVYSIG